MSHDSVRDEIVQTLHRNLFGPADGQTETFSADGKETPVTRYMTGILYPSDAVLPPEEDDGDLSCESAQSAHEDEARLSLCNAPNPSSFGITFACRRGSGPLRIAVKCGTYRLERDPAGLPLRWIRSPFSATADVPVEAVRKVVRLPLAPGLEVRVTFRPPDRFGALAITATLINTHSLAGARWEERPALAFFQCALSVSGTETSPPFIERRPRDTSHLDPELRHALLLYSHAKHYAVGHGCAADWDPKGDGVPTSVMMSFIPVHDIFPLVPPKDLAVPELPLARLATEDLKATTARLTKLADAYEAWIAAKAKLAERAPTEFSKVAEEQIAACHDSAGRIRKGIEALADPTVFAAFRLAQETMLQVFGRSRWLKAGADRAKPAKFGDEHTWYPFQMAFFLQALESLANPKSKDRDICDLLWFPTGGGKTEAYLALTAMAFFLRRLRATGDATGGGTSVLMRYTLRLLTADQFVRACLMTCAAEVVRRKNAKLANKAPITIGLWVGEGTTPNSNEQAAEALKVLHGGRRLVGKSSPIKLKKCPWCATGLGNSEYKMAPDGSGMRIRCRNSECDFRHGIPAFVVDQQIYDERPSLVLGTVDKFARLPWEPRAGNLFSTDRRHGAPDLVIQDELHLISGPLGTISGLYEAAVDLLCTRDGIRPKVVASTATIRNAVSQVRYLFDRRFAQFPQPLLDARDSFFARENREKSPRRFVGLFTPGKTHVTAFIRMAGTLGHAAFASKADDADVDPYWTTIAYFNSLRELGGAIVRVHDDVAAYMKVCATLDGSAPLHRTMDAVEELTSRASEEKLDDVRDGLWERKGKGHPYDMVLCSNMISVGLDVPRLGLMSVIGQPKTTAEYIQASSRIGRAFPGLVVTLYNWSRSRDRSHYERFVAYHSRLYAEVEATSVTPYSSRALDRALHSVLVSLVRHLVPELRDKGSAGAFRRSDPQVAQIINDLKRRMGSIELVPADASAAQAHLDRVAERWERMAVAGGAKVTYSGDADNSLLVMFEEHTVHNPGFATMNNMRNVDAPAGVYLL